MKKLLLIASFLPSLLCAEPQEQVTQAQIEELKQMYQQQLAIQEQQLRIQQYLYMQGFIRPAPPVYSPITQTHQIGNSNYTFGGGEIKVERQIGNIQLNTGGN